MSNNSPGAVNDAPRVETNGQTQEPIGLAMVVNGLIPEIPTDRLLLSRQIHTTSEWCSFREMLENLTAQQISFFAVVESSIALSETELSPDSTAYHTMHVDKAFGGTAIEAGRECVEQFEAAVLVLQTETPAVSEQRLRPRPASSQRIVAADVAREDRRAIRNKSFRSDVRRWISSYNAVGKRDWYLWQWCLHGIEMTTLPSVPEAIRADLADTKLLSVILCVLFDDVADQPGNEEWLDALLCSIREGKLTNQDLVHLSGNKHADHICVTAELWSEYEERVSALPSYEGLMRLWRFDIDQFLTAMRYGQLINSIPELANPTEQDVYTPHNMLMVSFGTLDLMCSVDIPREEYGLIREALWHAQAMGRVGNVLSTWKRELSERDMSNGLVARALCAGIFTRDQFLSTPVEMLEQQLDEAGYRKQLMEKWHRHRRLCEHHVNRIYSMDLLPTLHAHDRFLEMHLSSEGLI